MLSLSLSLSLPPSLPPSLSLSLSWDQLVCTNSTLSGPTDFSVAQWAVTVDEHSMRSCVWVHFPDGFPHYAWPALLASSEFVGSRGVYSVFNCNLPPAFLAEWQGSLTFYDANMRVEQIPDTKLTVSTKVDWPGEEIFPLLLRGTEPVTLRSQVQRCSNQLSLTHDSVLSTTSTLTITVHQQVWLFSFLLYLCLISVCKYLDFCILSTTQGLLGTIKLFITKHTLKYSSHIIICKTILEWNVQDQSKNK